MLIGPLSGIMFLAGLLMIVVGRNRNNDDLFRWDFRDSGGNDGEFNRQKFFLIGILLVIAAVVIWFYLMFFDSGESASDASASIFSRLLTLRTKV